MKKNGLSENQFWADNTLSEKIPEWKQIFMSMLIKYYKKHRTDGLILPKLVIEGTVNYHKSCDIFQDFISDYLEKTGKAKDSINITVLCEGLRSWYKANYDGKCPNVSELRNYMIHRMTPSSYDNITDSLTRYKLKTNDEFETLNELANIQNP